MWQVLYHPWWTAEVGRSGWDLRGSRARNMAMGRRAVETPSAGNTTSTATKMQAPTQAHAKWNLISALYHKQFPPFICIFISMLGHMQLFYNENPWIRFRFKMLFFLLPPDKGFLEVCRHYTRVLCTM